jgi:hypothetical protein
LWATAKATLGTGITIVAAPVFLRVGRVTLSSAIAEEGHGILYPFDYYWGRARKHVAAIYMKPVQIKVEYDQLLGMRHRAQSR